MLIVNLIMALAVSGPASATAALTPKLVFRTENGAVHPRYKKIRRCEIGTKTLLQVTYGPLIRPMPVKRSVAWTAQVPNARGMQELVLKAQMGRVSKKRGAVGGAETSYMALQLDKGELQSQWVLLASGSEEQVNHSEAARTLVEFMDFNCNRQ